jgi:hypothetical protein
LLDYFKNQIVHGDISSHPEIGLRKHVIGQPCFAGPLNTDQATEGSSTNTPLSKSLIPLAFMSFSSHFCIKQYLVDFEARNQTTRG